MNETMQAHACDPELETWKETCRELQHFNREIKSLSQKILAYFIGDETATVEAIEVNCRNYLTAANQRYAALRRLIQDHRDNAHYSLKQVLEFEKQASESVDHARRAWEEMVSWIPKDPADSGKVD